MMKEFTYLHLTDLHFGSAFARPYWSNIKDAFFKDIDYICGKLLHGIDVIFITGDLVQTGNADDFKEFEKFIEECMSHLMGKCAKKPVVLIVPGNHDLQRCANEGVAELEMLKQWTSQDKLRHTYFWADNSQYLKFVNASFNNYSSFVHKFDEQQKIEKKEGCVVGDFYTSLDLNGIKLGIVGLNSSFLQLTAGDYQKKVGVYLKQLCSILGDNYGEELHKNDFNVLLTHHAPDWYEQESKSQFDSEIYSQEKFLEHYCGHNHIAQTTSSSTNNADTKHLNVGHSLFGVEFDDKEFTRIHGYEAGKYVLNNDGSIDKIVYPRLASRKSDGWDFDKDISFSCKKGDDGYHVSLKKVSDKGVRNNIDMMGGDVLDRKSNQAKIPSIPLRDSKSHIYIRNYERETARAGLEREHFLWVTTHYGLCSERFVSSVLDCSGVHYDVFCVNLEDCKTIEEVENQVKEQFGEHFNMLVDDISKAYENPLLLFKGVSNEFVKVYAENFFQLISSALDFNKNLSAIVISNVKYERQALTLIELNPLSLDELKIYVEHSSKHSSWGLMEWEKIHAMSGGYPLSIDMILSELQFVDIDDLDITDYLFNGASNDLPNAVQTYIQELRMSDTKEEKRKFQLLFLLSSLPKGESFSSIKRYNPCMPFYPMDIDTLQDRDLLVVDYYYNISKDKKNIVPTKILHVPAIYRNYICGLEDDNSKELLHERICEMYLGTKWKTGKIVIQKSGESFANNNISSSLSYLVKNSLLNVMKLNRYLRIAGSFVREMENMSLFYTGCVAAKELYDLVHGENINDAEFRSNRAYLKYEYASLLRMMHYYNESKILFEELLQENILLKPQLQSCRECLAYLSEGRDKEKYANELIVNEKNSNSLMSLIGRYIIDLQEKTIEQRRKKLKSILNQVKKNHTDSNLMANVTISLSTIDDVEKSIKAIDFALGEVKDSYSRMRLTARRYELVMGRENPTFSASDIEAVRCVYTYSFTQMLPNLLTPVHRILWDYYMKISDYQQVAMLYKYSNFVWTIKGDVALQQEFQEKVNCCPQLIQWMREHRNEIEI